MITLLALLSCAPKDAPLASAAASTPDFSAQADAFLEVYNSLFVSLYRPLQLADWAASTDVNDENQGLRTGANQVWAAFVGDPATLARAKALLAHPAELSPLQVKQLRTVIYMAGASPGHLPDLVNARIEAETRAAATLDGYVFCFEPRKADGTCAAPKTANDIDNILQNSTDLAERRKVWEASKEIGKDLKPHLVELRDLRNQVAREMGYSSFFGLMCAEYGMTADEMMALLDGLVVDMEPLYGSVRDWASVELAGRYGQPVPTGLVPAHWYPNRWAQEWSGLVKAIDLDPYFANKDPKWILETGEDFYVSMGMPKLPQAYWDGSDNFPAEKGSPRLKNSHASAWDMDLTHDVRTLMSVEANSQWFFTTHHEFGHIYYYLAYDRPLVPPILRKGANRAFHEGIGELMALASGQVPYLKRRGILAPDAEIDPVQSMLNEALITTVAFIPWSAGVMSRFEYELYEKDLPPEMWQKRWWELVEKYQGAAPPSADRINDPDLCDACTKTHIIDDPAGYYDYALATVIKYQLHEHIAKEILHTAPQAADYYGNKEVGDYVWGILQKGATEDWRDVLKEATGEGLTTRPMVEYYEPLSKWLKEQGR